MCGPGKKLRYQNSKCNWCRNNFYYKHVTLAGATSMPLANEDSTATNRWETGPLSHKELVNSRAGTRTHMTSFPTHCFCLPFSSKMWSLYTCLLFHKFPSSRNEGQTQICLRKRPGTAIWYPLRFPSPTGGQSPWPLSHFSQSRRGS